MKKSSFFLSSLASLLFFLAFSFFTVQNSFASSFTDDCSSSVNGYTGWSNVKEEEVCYKDLGSDVWAFSSAGSYTVAKCMDYTIASRPVITSCIPYKKPTNGCIEGFTESGTQCVPKNDHIIATDDDFSETLINPLEGTTLDVLTNDE